MQAPLSLFGDFLQLFLSIFPCQVWLVVALSLFSMSVSPDRNLANHSCARRMVTTSSSYALFSHLAASVAESWFLKQRRRPNRICVLSILMFSLRLQISNDKCISIAHQIKEDKMTNTMTKTESKKVDKQERYD